MRSWKQLEADFRTLAPALEFSRLDLQWGAAGEYWRIAGRPGPAEGRFRALARLAGQRLATFRVAPETQDLSDAPDDETRWIRALKHLSGALEHGNPAQQLNDDGSSAGWIYSGHVRHFTEASATLCLYLESAEAELQADVRERLSGERWQGARTHWTKALDFREADPPDLPKAAKEAVAAIEAVAKVTLAQPTGTLGDCIKELRKRSEVSAPLLKVLEGLWGFSSESPGIRHGSTEPPTITPTEARFVFSIAEAGIHLLLDLRAAV